MSEKAPIASSDVLRNGPNLIERARALPEYFRAKREMRNAYERTYRALDGEVHGEDGKLVEPRAYGAGLHLPSPLTEAETGNLYAQLRGQLTQRLGVIPSMSSQEVLSVAPGHFSTSVEYPVVEIPTVGYNSQGMTENQIAELRRLQHKIARAGCIDLEVNVQPTSLGGGMQHKKSPGILLMDDHPNFKIEVAPMQGFQQQEQAAKVVFQSLMDTNVMRSKHSSAPPSQLPSAESNS